MFKPTVENPMCIYFEGKIKGDYPYINTATFQLPSGEEIVVDRQITEYTIEDGKITMDWIGCYIWDGEKECYDFPEDFQSAKLMSIYIDDDEPEDYDVTITDYSL